MNPLLAASSLWVSSRNLAFTWKGKREEDNDNDIAVKRRVERMSDETHREVINAEDLNIPLATFVGRSFFS